jgi:hypothetical protein
MSTRATISVTGVGAADLSAFLTQDGFLNMLEIVVEEELTTAGVRGRRWRTVSQQYPPFTAESTAPAADWGQAVNLKQLYESFVGQLCTLLVFSGGRTYIGRDVKIRAVAAVPVPGELADADRTIAPCHIVATWSFVFTREGDT